jgi:hypothetical protein
MKSVLSATSVKATVAAVCILIFGASAPALAKCNPNGTANEVIECIDEDNAAQKSRLAGFYPSHLNSFDVKCQQQNPGGGSGGHQDRAFCLQNMLKEEASRVGMSPNK